MSNVSTAPQNQPSTSPASNPANTGATRIIRLWPAVIFVALFWVFHYASDYVEMSMFMRFVTRFAVLGIVLLGFVAWWMFFSRARWSDRLLALVVFIGGALITGALADKQTLGSVGILGVFVAGLPFVATIWLAWLAISNRWLHLSPTVQRVGLCFLILATWGCFDLVRWEGLDGGQHSAFAWRWSKTSEQSFLAEHHQKNISGASQNQSTETSNTQLTIRPDDWVEFRGAQRNGQIHGLKLATDWEHQPPKRLWRQKVGPAWSSVIVIDGLLFTQEQRGDQEVTVCYDAATGQERWAHADSTRFFEPLAGAGPRGTPTFADGHIYSLGATGKLNCLDPRTGHLLWSHDIVIDGGAEITAQAFAPRQWGYSNSPLVADGLVFVFAGGTKEKGLLAYHADSGELAWSAPAGADGYSSPQLVTLAGQKQILMHANSGLIAFDPATGKQLWQLPCASDKFLPITQPQIVGPDKLLIQSENGIQLIKLTVDGDKWTPTQQWDSRSLKLTLNDYVVHDGSIYGFDDNIFCCLDLETGKRRWKAGRYGSGQVLLLPDQPLLVVTTETGEAVLVSPNPKKLEELGRFQAIEGKTWNHPVIAEGKLFVRNAEEMACYELLPAGSAPAAPLAVSR